MKQFIVSSRYSIFKLVNLFLRVAPLGIKFLFFTVLSKVMSPNEYGSYTLITTTITVSIFILGIDFYNYSIREILLSKTKIFEKLFTTFLLYFCIYVIVSIGVLGYFQLFNSTSEFSGKLIVTLMLICFSEHFCQEAYRIQIACKKILIANLIFFFRLFFWMFYLTVEVLFFQTHISIDHILNIWVIFNLLAVFLNILSANKAIRSNLDSLSLNIEFIKKGLAISGLFFMGTLSLKMIEYLNRYVVDLFLGKEITGIFSFYSNLALVISVYINAIVISFELPALIEKGMSKNINIYFEDFKKTFLKQIIIIVIILLVLIFPILKWQNIPMYQDYLYIFFIMLLASAIINYSLVYHFYLYVKKKDKTILVITIKAGLVNIVSTLILTYIWGVLGTCIAFLVTSIYMIYLRKSSSKKIGYE